RKYVRAVNDVSFGVRAGESFGIVGESGSGKSTLARLIMGLEKPSDGSLLFDNRKVNFERGAAGRKYWKQVQMVFQDPFSSLNPRMTIGAILAEPLRNFSGPSRAGLSDRVAQ